eukprot:scaffold5259_cov168-Ochromonas_danica.AAC.8
MPGVHVCGYAARTVYYYVIVCNNSKCNNRCSDEMRPVLRRWPTSKARSTARLFVRVVKESVSK